MNSSSTKTGNHGGLWFCNRFLFLFSDVTCSHTTVCLTFLRFTTVIIRQRVYNATNSKIKVLGILSGNNNYLKIEGVAVTFIVFMKIYCCKYKMAL